MTKLLFSDFLAGKNDAGDDADEIYCLYHRFLSTLFSVKVIWICRQLEKTRLWPLKQPELGLSKDQIEEAEAKHGKNELPAEEGKSLWELIGEFKFNFHQLINGWIEFINSPDVLIRCGKVALFTSEFPFSGRCKQSNFFGQKLIPAIKFRFYSWAIRRSPRTNFTASGDRLICSRLFRRRRRVLSLFMQFCLKNTYFKIDYCFCRAICHFGYSYRQRHCWNLARKERGIGDRGAQRIRIRNCKSRPSW